MLPRTRRQRILSASAASLGVGIGLVLLLAGQRPGEAVDATADAQAAAQLEQATQRAMQAVHLAQRDALRPLALDAARRDATAFALDVAETAAGFAQGSRFVGVVRYTLPHGYDVHDVLRRYELDVQDLAAMNPGVDLAELAGGDVVVVYERGLAERSVSLGAPNRGRLTGGVPMPQGDHWIVRNATYSWGTPSTIMALVHGLTATAVAHPGGTIPLVADLSRRTGGRLRPHRSHQSGRDADVTYYITTPGPSPGFRPVSPMTLDAVRQWELFEYWIENGMVDYIFTDRRLIPALAMQAIEAGASDELYRAAFGVRGDGGIIRHERGHDDHLHVRFACDPDDPVCQSTR
jgi:hypothetical protein